MFSKILEHIEEDLQSVHNLIRKQLLLKAGHLGSFAHLEYSFINRNIRPALIILTARIYGHESVKATALAGVCQLIYMATKVQQGISENDTDYLRGDSDPRDGSQFPVLAGDYLYGKFFTTLSNEDMINLLNPLAEIICQTQEGSILKKKLNGQNPSQKVFLEVVRKETAEFFAGCCMLSARLAGAPEEDQELMRRFGINLGMAFGLLELGVPVEHASVYLTEAINILSKIPKKPERDLLEQLVRNLSGHGLSVRRMVI